MKRNFLTLLLSLTLTLSLAGCAFSRPVQSAAPTAEPAGSAEEPADSEPADVVVETGRQNGERFESVIQLEGMEETVQYEHVVSRAAGFEIDYEYENLVRRSEADRELFLSAWDDPAQPVNYLEVRYDTGNAELVASALNAGLAASYDTTGPRGPLPAHRRLPGQGRGPGISDAEGVYHPHLRRLPYRHGPLFARSR